MQASECSVTGYLLDLKMYTGKDLSGNTIYHLGEDVVLKLARGFEGWDYCVFFDNFSV